MTEKSTVFVVDDDPAVCKFLRMLIDSAGHDVETYPSAEAFLTAYSSNRPGCLVLDVQMTGLSGLELQQQLNRESIRMPIIMITGHGDVPMAVSAMRTGAVDFIQKPIDGPLLLERIAQALVLDSATRERQAQELENHKLLAQLSAREHEVLDSLVKGAANKVIASNLAISIKTVEYHRANIMKKMKARAFADLVRIAVKCGIG